MVASGITTSLRILVHSPRVESSIAPARERMEIWALTLSMKNGDGTRINENVQ